MGVNIETIFDIANDLEEIPTYKDRIEKALKIAWQYAQIDGAHHKAWTIDQMVRALCGTKEEYNNWVEAYETPVGYDEYYEWDCGIAP